jgi:hypothetical protein
VAAGRSTMSGRPVAGRPMALSARSPVASFISGAVPGVKDGAFVDRPGPYAELQFDPRCWIHREVIGV